MKRANDKIQDKLKKLAELELEKIKLEYKKEDLELDQLVESLDRTVIQCNHLTKDFDFGEFLVRAVDDVSFSIKKGDFVAIQGPSGAGKTTFLSLIAGLDKPTQGEIRIEWVRITDFEEDTMSTFRVLNLGFIFQNYNLISSLTAEENIKFPMQLADIELEKQNERVTFLLDKVALLDRNEHLPYQLSAGEQQRVGIARALANNPPIILADEPTANLDNKSSDIISNLFKELSETGKTILVVTHDDRLLKHANRIITFEESKIIKDERIRDIVLNPEQTENINIMQKIEKKIDERLEELETYILNLKDENLREKGVD